MKRRILALRSNAALQLAGEAIDGSPGGLYSKTLSRNYATSGVLGRYTGMNIGTEYTVGYGYDAHGRPGSLTAGFDTFTFAYLADSNLLASIAYPNDISATRAYEPNRDLITQVQNQHDTTVVSNYFYENDVIGRRRFMEKSGTAFAFHPQTDRITYEYNDRSEVTSAVSANIATYDYGFAFDPIGNRLTSTSKETGTPVTRNYTSNVLNQYTAIDYPSATPSYDDDGNMTSLPISSGTWDCSWNAENRLIAMEKAEKRLEFAYDYMGRRVEKKTFTGSSGNWTLATHLRFVYDGYLQIEELDGMDSNALLKKRYWTGVEGYDRLISETHVGTGNTYYVMADANKNLTEYLTNAGASAGHYEYSPFGQITQVSGGLSDQFDFRFSSEAFDVKTGLVYYNFRYYSPELGRWASRDPIKEYGGWNLYSFVWNSPFLWWDLLGLMGCKPSPHLIPDAEEWDRIVKELPPPDEGMTLDEYKDAVQESGETGEKLKLWERILDKLRGATETISPKKNKNCPPCDPPPPLMEIDTEDLFKDDPLPPLTPINPDDLEIIPRRRR